MSKPERREASTVYKSSGPVEVELIREVWRLAGREWEQHRLLMQSGRSGVVVVAVNSNGELLLGRQWRAATGEWSWEFPRGFGESGDVARDTLRELEEETGYAGAEASVIGRFYTDSGVITNDAVVSTVSVRSNVPGSRDDEINEMRWVGPRQLAHEIGDGSITDGITISAFALWQLRGQER